MKKLPIRLINFKYNKFNPSVSEWKDSIYSFKKYSLNTYLNEKVINILLNSYFNLTHFKEDKFYSLKRIVVGQPDIKHSIHSIILNIYIFNKEKLFYLKRIKSLKEKKVFFYKTENIKQVSNKPDLVTKIINNLDKKNFNLENYYRNEYLKNNIKYLYIDIKANLEEKIYTLYLYKNYMSKLCLNTFKFKILNLSNLIQILSNIYNKKVIVNITNIKYLHMDNSLLVDAIIRKLRDRDKRVLKVLRKALSLSNIPRIQPLLLIKSNKWLKKPFDFNTENILYKNLIRSKEFIQKNVFEHIKNIHIIGIRLEGNGRLTRRLTASRSLHKVTYVGTMKNIFSSYQGYSSKTLKGFQNSNIDYINVNSYNRNGSFGIRSSQTTY